MHGEQRFYAPMIESSRCAQPLPIAVQAPPNHFIAGVPHSHRSIPSALCPERDLSNPRWDIFTFSINATPKTGRLSSFYLAILVGVQLTRT